VSSEAWELARRAAVDAAVELRPLETLEDCDAIIDVMVATWGDYQTVPREVIRALAESGNVPYGAFAGETVVGYVLGWAAVDPEEGLHVHSHQLATLPYRRHAGVGYALKLAQRAQALDQGISVARWTFDPLVARNAYFNIHKLGAIGDRFERNFYGEMTDELNRGDRSDRLIVRWDLERMPGANDALPSDGPTILQRRVGDEPRSVGDPDRGVAFVEVPAEYAALRAMSPDVGRAWRELVADAIESCLERGLVAVSFDRERSAYVFATTHAPRGAA
jgi:predicted GNAT superfamily acetyltransferase